jgi:LPS-assembly protein
MAEDNAPKLYAAEGVCVPDTVPFMAPRPGEADKDPAKLPIHLEADKVEALKEGPVVLTGKAVVTQGTRSISGDRITYDKSTDEVEAEGNVVLRTLSGDKINTPYLRYKVDTGVGHTKEAHYQMADRSRKTGDSKTQAVKARGDAKQIFFEGQDLIRLKNATYTTCVEGKDDVMVNAGQLTLDQSTGIGSAKNVRVKFMNAPLYYAPSMTFPISDQRKSGFLTPTFGDEGDSGFGVALPYYWNIAPNQDATFTPKLMADRGLMLQGQYRYLQHNYDGRVEATYLPNDRAYPDKDRNDRGAFTFIHNQRFSDRWTGNVNFQWVSDTNYLDDFSNELGLSSSTVLPQQIATRYNGKLWNVGVDVLGYQTVDSTVPKSARPQDRLPRITFATNLPRAKNGIAYGVQGELVDFRSDTNVEGTRLDLTPTVSWRLEKVYGYLEPKLAVRHTSYYSLNNISAGQPTDPSRTVGIFSFDSGLYFERDTTWAGSSFIQTLEPRLYYVYAQRKNQDNLPVFDTGVLELNNFGNFFRDNRFTGADRVGDANRVTLALTSRMLESKTGKEWMRASIGQVYYFSDRTVTLYGSPADTANTSDIVGEVKAKVSPAVSLQGFMQWDTQDNEVQEGRFDAVYKPDAYRQVGLSYRYLRNASEQADLYGYWPLGRRWFFRGDYWYSIRDSKLLATRASVEYNACCWALRFGAQRRVNNATDYRNAVFVELELSGLTSIRTGF